MKNFFKILLSIISTVLLIPVTLQLLFWGYVSIIDIINSGNIAGTDNALFFALPLSAAVDLILFIFVINYQKKLAYTGIIINVIALCVSCLVFLNSYN